MAFLNWATHVLQW